MQRMLPQAETKIISGPAGEIPLRILHAKEPRGVYLHLHSGGWMLGSNDMQDEELIRIVDSCNLTVVSVEYRLAPENPYPAGPDDCEAAALWLARKGENIFGTSRFAIGGESAGAHLSVLTLLRLRDRHNLKPFIAANLNAGSYDLSLTPSAQNWGTERLIITTRDIRNFVAGFLPGHDLKDPAVSPLYAQLHDLPRALFTVGTRDPLFDDSMMMQQRWQDSGNAAEINIVPGGCHVFQRFFTPSGIACMERQAAFLNAAFA